jgi:hypothetical protein
MVIMLGHHYEPEKGDRKLRRRIQKLYQRGVDPTLAATETTMREVLDVVGDLTLWEIVRLVNIATWDHNKAIQEQLDRDPLGLRGPR